MNDTDSAKLESVAVVLAGKCATKITEFERFESFIDAIKKSGYVIRPVSDTSASRYITIDHSWKHLLAIRKQVPTMHRVLVLREGRVVRPDQYHKIVLKRYGAIYSCSSISVPGVSFIPYTDGFLPRRGKIGLKQSNESHSLCIVNTNKFSLHPLSNYSFRQKAIAAAAAAGFAVSVAGTGWSLKFRGYFLQQVKSALDSMIRFGPIDIKQFRKPMSRHITTKISIHGFVNDHISFMKDHDFALVIENDMSRITEKIFDAIYSGCIPIYFGPEMTDTELPNNLYVCINSERDLVQQFINFLKLSNEQRQNIRQQGQEWITKESTTQRWSEAVSMHKLWNCIEKTLNSNPRESSNDAKKMRA